MPIKKILITGGAGFIGANLARRLVAEKTHEVFIIEKPGTNLWRLKDILHEVAVKEVSLDQQENLLAIVRGIKPDTVFHFAGYGAYPATQNNVDEMVKVNIQGTLNVLSAVEDLPIASFVNIGSSSEYKEKKSAITEDDAPDPANLYAITKLASTLLAKKIAQDKNLPVINLRPFNVYGYYGTPEGLMPHIILHTLRGKSVSLHFSQNVRDFVFIDDVVELFMKIIASKRTWRGDIFNVGSGKQHSIGQVVGMVEKELGKKAKVTYASHSTHYRKSSSFKADIRKTKKVFGWKPENTVAMGIKKTVQWFKSNIDLYP